MANFAESAHQPSISVIIPVCNEPPEILNNINALIELDGIAEVIVVDASQDHLRASARKILQPTIQLIHTNQPGRASQMNLGAQSASGDIVWFLHADTSPPADAASLIRRSVSPASPWGRFDVCFDSTAQRMKLIAFAMNLRSSLSRICTGDQAIFVEQGVFRELGGYPDIAIMEDIALSKSLKRVGRMNRIRTPVTTSARRWEHHGYVRTIVLMWLMRLLYWLGVSPAKLARLYRQAR